MKSNSTIKVNDEATARALRGVDKAIKDNATPFQGARFIEVIADAAGPRVIGHGLKRVPKGWFVVDVQRTTTTDYPVRSDWDKTNITINFAASGVYKILVF